MHRAMSGADREPDVAGFAIHGEQPAEPVLGRLVQRGLDDELKGSAYAIVEGVDGRTHHLTLLRPGTDRRRTAGRHRRDPIL